MHGSRAANAVLLAGLKEAGPWNADVAVCVPFPYISETALALTGVSIGFGAQDCSAHEQGAFTGEVSSAMLHDIGCRYVIASRLGRVVQGIRDAEGRTRFIGYQVESYKLWIWVFSAMLAGIAGALYVPQVGIINPGAVAPVSATGVVIW
eukprot:gene46838-58414_t